MFKAVLSSNDDQCFEVKGAKMYSPVTATSVSNRVLGPDESGSLRFIFAETPFEHSLRWPLKGLSPNIVCRIRSSFLRNLH